MNDLLEFNVFGDIAGRYDELQLLIKQMPKAMPISVGDMIDRGPKSKYVLDYFKNNGLAVQANHEHLMIDLWEDNGYYDRGMWLLNGGFATVNSFITHGNIGTTVCPELPELFDVVRRINRSTMTLPNDMMELNILTKACLPWFREVIPQEYITYLKGLPKFIKCAGAVITHAAINPTLPFERVQDYGKNCRTRECDNSIIWNRGGVRRQSHFQIHGHMSHRNVEWYTDKEGIYGVNLDTSKGKKLTVMHWPSMKAYSVDYLD